MYAMGTTCTVTSPVTLLSHIFGTSNDVSLPIETVAANHENDSCFPNGLVMGLADCIDYARLVKPLEKSSRCKLGPLPDTLQAGACVFPPFQNVKGSH